MSCIFLCPNSGLTENAWHFSDRVTHATTLRGCANTVGETALKAESGAKLLCSTWDWNLRDERVGLDAESAQLLPLPTPFTTAGSVSIYFWVGVLRWNTAVTVPRTLPPSLCGVPRTLPPSLCGVPRTLPPSLCGIPRTLPPSLWEYRGHSRHRFVEYRGHSRHRFGSTADTPAIALWSTADTSAIALGVPRTLPPSLCGVPRTLPPSLWGVPRTLPPSLWEYRGHSRHRFVEYRRHSRHRFPASSELEGGCRKTVLGVWVPRTPEIRSPPLSKIPTTPTPTINLCYILSLDSRRSLRFLSMHRALCIIQNREVRKKRKEKSIKRYSINFGTTKADSKRLGV